MLTISTLLFASSLLATASPATELTSTVSALVNSLDDAQRAETVYPFDADERWDWHFIPRERNGVALRELSGAARDSADQLIMSGLSTAGYEKVLQVRSLEEVLYLFEGGEEAARRERRHPHKYYITVFGTPAAKGEWGWRVEGHHVSLNFTLKDNQIVSSTPEFLGANPGLIDAGPGRSLRVLGRREDLARDILKACNETQTKAMWLSKEAPDDVRGGGVIQPVVTEAVGLRIRRRGEDTRCRPERWSS